MAARRGLILPVVLVLVGLLALTLAGFIFFIRAETAGTIAHSDGQQARLAVESGLEEVVAVLRVERHNVGAWFDLPARFRHALVWSSAYNRADDPVREMGSRTAVFERGERIAPAWRYSIVAENLDGLPDTMRFGITPEASKLNLNAASEQQIEALLAPVLLELGVENAQDLINALLDWRDQDTLARPGGAENEYYNTLDPPYMVKSTGRFDTLEELLLIKGFSAAILCGEDTNRNGILDANEDDGEETAPYYDNADGILNRGIAPYLTVWSRESDVALDNKPRINLNGPAATITAKIAEYFQEGELSDATINFILGLKQQSFSFAQLGSPAELYQGAGLAAGEGEGAGGGAAGPLASSPVLPEELPHIMDRFSTLVLQEGQPVIEGLIHVNTAPARVLAVIPGMDPTSAAAIVAMRRELEPEALRTTAWPLLSGALSLPVFQAVAPFLTTKAHQFRVEVLGYADHVKLARREEFVIEMIGPLAQMRYRRDLTGLGIAWPVDDDKVVVTDR